MGITATIARATTTWSRWDEWDEWGNIPHSLVIRAWTLVIFSALACLLESS
jgi:hypothetical protein